MSKKRPKVIIVLCEGATDRIALEELLENLFDETQVSFTFQSGDLTTSCERQYIKAAVGRAVECAKNSLSIQNKDILKVACLTDSDGCFIPDHAVIEDSSIEKAVYCDQSIKHKSKKAIIGRNHKKRDNLNLLIGTSYVKRNIEFKIYYNSCNLDHVTGNKRNVTQKEKRELAEAFSYKYLADLPGFVSFFADKSLTNGETNYQQSWEMLRKNYESLQRHSNLLVFILDNYEYLNDETKEILNTLDLIPHRKQKLNS